MTATTFASILADPFRIVSESAADFIRGSKSTGRHRVSLTTFGEVDDHLLRDIGIHDRAEIVPALQARRPERRHKDVRN